MNDGNVWGSAEDAAPEPVRHGDVVEGQPRDERWNGPDVEEDGWSIPFALQAPVASTLGAAAAYGLETDLTLGDGRTRQRDVQTSSSSSNQALPYGIDAEVVRADITRWAEIEISCATVPSEMRFEGEGCVDPLSIDSTRDLWRRLTTVRSRLVRFEGSNVKREVTSILTSWNLRTKSQPSWDRHRPAKQKKRESIGSELFNWNRTDLPAWTASPVPHASRRSSVRDSSVSLHTLVEDHNEFGDFESAPPLIVDDPDMSTLPNNVSETEDDPRTANKAASQKDGQDLTLAVHTMDDDLFNVATPETMTESAVPTLTLVSTRIPAPDQMSTTRATDPTWDFSLFERQFLQQETADNKASSDVKTRPRSGTKTRREMENQETVERIVSLLPKIEYLLSCFVHLCQISSCIYHFQKMSFLSWKSPITTEEFLLA